jgi:hypothetical protein
MKVRIFGTSLLAQPVNNVYPNNLLIEMSVIANGLFSHPEHVSTIKQKEEMIEIVQNTRICTTLVVIVVKTTWVVGD